jgi:hypothetical protein
MALPKVGSAIINSIRKIGTTRLKNLLKNKDIKKSRFHLNEIKKELDSRGKTPLRNMGGKKIK